MKPDVLVELKALRLHGMAGAWADLVEQGGDAGIDASRWLIEHLLQAEGTDRAMRSVSHQMKAANSAAPTMPGSTSGKVTFQKVLPGPA